jgi:hypothetical protein
VTDDCAVWVYAVAHWIDDDGLDAVAGVNGGPVRAVTAAGLAAAVTTVSLDDFGEAALRRHLEDLSWLDATARVHHHVIEILARHGPVAPMRLAAVFRNDRSVADMLTQRRDDFTAMLQHVTGKLEWGVKVYAAGRKEAPPGPGHGRRTVPDTAVSPGAAYLRRRRAALSATEDTRRAALASADAVYAVLGPLAASAQLRPPQAPQLSGETAPMILNAAYLVDEERSQEFAAAADRLAGEHPAVRLELTGPWPPYSFATMESLETAGNGTSA